MTKGTGWVVGLNHGSHDASSALLHNGKVVAFAEEERFTRRKHAIEQAPVHALKWCLDVAGITLADLDCIALGSDHTLLARWLGCNTDEAAKVTAMESPDRLLPVSVFGPGPRPTILPFRHHLAHAASAFWPSGHEEAAILVMDAMGEDASAILAHGTHAGIKTLRTYPIDVSLGFFYEAATTYVGFGPHEAGKLMGLAAYGKARQPIPLRFDDGAPVWSDIPTVTSRGRQLIEQRTTALATFFETNCFPYERGLSREALAYADFASSVQLSLQEVVHGLAAELKRLTNSSTLVLAGGVALNCTVNGNLARSGLYEHIFVQPAAHDAGVALGAGLLASHRGQPESVNAHAMAHAYWGPSFRDEEIEHEFVARGLPFTRLSCQEVADKTAALLAAGGIVAWHQGRSEVGPRALGGRSLLGDPRTRRTLIRLNQLKGREMWRPLAPSVLCEHFGAFFMGQPNPFMTMAADVRPEAKSRIPAVVHADGSARPQVVFPEHNPAYGRLLESFNQLTGVPVLVNTSLNLKGTPIANSPGDVLDLFLATDIEAAVISSYLIYRE